MQDVEAQIERARNPDVQDLWDRYVYEMKDWETIGIKGFLEWLNENGFVKLRGNKLEATVLPNGMTFMQWKKARISLKDRFIRKGGFIGASIGIPVTVFIFYNNTTHILGIILIGLIGGLVGAIVGAFIGSWIADLKNWRKNRKAEYEQYRKGE